MISESRSLIIHGLHTKLSNFVFVDFSFKIFQDYILGQYFYPFSFPPELPEKSDIDVRITTRSNNGRYTAAFDLLLVKNPNT